jgi:hemerythrin superfamily protein
MPNTIDAVSVLEGDHRSVEELFRRFEGSRDPAEQGRLFRRISRELSIHAAVEEQLVYPRLRAVLERGAREPEVLAALEEHHVAKVALAEIGALPPTHPRFEAKVHVLVANVRGHVAEEERALFPALRRHVGKDDLEALAAELLRARLIAPTRPHPAAPDEPPATLFVGLAAGAYDRSRDALAWTLDVAREGARRLVDGALRLGEESVRRTRGRLDRGIAGATRALDASAIGDEVERGRAAARRIQRRLGERVQGAGRELERATLH